ncbi:MAG: hypothetical protein ACYS21_18065 [Planctomycetota bacterium]|jgi:hypothetical protein
MATVTVAQPLFSQPVGYGVTSPSRLGAPSPLLAENIDPETHDYVSLTSGVHPIDSQVIIALKVARNSGASVTEDGQRFTTVKKITNTVKTQIESLVREALGRLIAQQDIEYFGTTFETVDPGNQTINATVQWANLRAADDQVRSAPLTVKGTAT